MFILILMVIGYCSYATHNRAGEITYEHVSGLTYRITITTYTKESSCAADRCELEINFGDNSKDTISRVNGTGNIGGICGTCDCQNCGELLGNDIKKNVYTVDHTYSGLGTYTISVEDPNRNDNINNIPNSVHVPFFISSELIIAPGLINESPTLTNPPIDNGCINFPYLHNPGAIDPDGDSLVYSIVPSLAGNGASIPNYVFPNQVSGCIGGTFSIDPVNGTLLWDSPNCQGEYNVAILIEEYRNGFKIGSVRRDMQITIKAPCPNQPPDILPLDPLCVFAGDTIQETVIATDPDIGDFLTLTATGEPLTLTNSPATFNTASAFDSVVSVFEWFTNCSHVRNNDYQTVFKVADDNSTVQLVDFETFVIKVIAPAPENLTAEPQGNSVILNWDPSFCPDISGYKIYRRIDSLGFSPDSCETGAPAGYNLIATINGNATMTYQDSDNLVHGQKYCYLIVACFP
ncbi:MAG: fibronectin type III domain-containing protein, partial [Flavobacteriales bacterium]|nr:fibronectin type III domain-containing protein [Flavobacteriales bacterium]